MNVFARFNKQSQVGEEVVDSLAESHRTVSTSNEEENVVDVR
jgi:hypothetical protein